MFSEKFPIIDPLKTGHTAADKLLEQKKLEELEANVDREEELRKKLAEQEELDREEIYANDDEEEWFKK